MRRKPNYKNASLPKVRRQITLTEDLYLAAVEMSAEICVNFSDYIKYLLLADLGPQLKKSNKQLFQNHVAEMKAKRKYIYKKTFRSRAKRVVVEDETDDQLPF